MYLVEVMECLSFSPTQTRAPSRFRIRTRKSLSPPESPLVPVILITLEVASIKPSPIQFAGLTHQKRKDQHCQQFKNAQRKQAC